MHLLILLAIVFYGEDIVSAQEQATCCDLKNTTCQSEFIVSLALRSLALGDAGFPAYNIGSIDPTYLRPATQLVMDFLNLTLHEGECLDIIKTCRILSFEMDTENNRRIIEVNCARIVVQGRYTLETPKVFEKVFGEKVSGHGNLTMVFEDWYFYYNYRYSFVERNNDIFLKLHHEDDIYRTSVNTSATFEADLIKLGRKNITKKVLSFMNKYWKDILDTFGHVLFDLSKVYYDENYDKLFYNLPATDMFCNNLTSLVNTCS